MQVFNYSTHMTSASCTYESDVDFKFKGSFSNNQQGINIFLHNCMLGARDVSMNNYSALVLSNDITLDDVFDMRTLETRPGFILDSRIGVSVTAETNASTKYLYFDNEDETLTQDYNVATSHRMLPLDKMPYPAQSIFNIEMLNEQYARICYKYKHEKFYLAVNSNEDIVFAAGYEPYDELNFNYIDETIFEYIFDNSGESLFLRKPLSGNRTKFLGVSGFDSNKMQILSASNAINYMHFNNFNLLVRSNFLETDAKLNASWASYATEDINKLYIDNETILTDLPSNMIVASQYCDATPTQVPARPIVLKNQATQLGTLDKASYTNLRNNNPGPINREYTNILAGNSQEKGDENISINFAMVGNDFVAKSDAYTAFKTSQSVFPYTQLNVNDASLRTDGAYAGDSPYTSDQILTLKNDAQGADGQYLCTWLSAGPNVKNAEWVDRYYNTNKMSPMDASKAVNATYGTYENFVNAYLQQQSFAYDFFDKKSDVTFTPNTEYFYYRIGNKRIEQQLNTHAKTLVADGLQWKSSNNQPYSDAYIAGKSYALDGNSYDVIRNYDAVNSNYGFTISFWLKCDDWNRLNGYQILGNLTSTGFGFIIDPVVTPFILMQSTSAINIYNSNFEPITNTLIPERPIATAQFDATSDFGIITNNAIYKLQADGTLYDKFTLVKRASAAAIDTKTQLNIWFDDSGSMDETLAPLQEMRDTILKATLLPFFDNDETIYNERVQVKLFSEYPMINNNIYYDLGSFERTLLMLSAPRTSNSITRVINLVFQDESSPYNAEIPNFNTSVATDVLKFDIINARRYFTTSPYDVNSVIFQVHTENGRYKGFRGFLNAIQNGTDYYAGDNGLSDIDAVDYVYRVTPAYTPQYYAQLITAQLNALNLIPNDDAVPQQLTNNWIDVAQNGDSIYILHSDKATVSHFNFITETLSTFTTTSGSNSITYGDRGIVSTTGTKTVAYGENTVLYLYNDNQIISYNYANNKQFVAFRSLSAGSTIKYIRDFCTDRENNIYILNGDTEIVKFNGERVLQYRILANPALSALSAVNFAIANCYEYIGLENIDATIVASRDLNDNIYLTKINKDGIITETRATAIKYYKDTLYNLTNAYYLQQKYQNRGKKLDFVLKLENKYNNRDIKTVTTSIDLSKLQPGTKHFALRLDAIQGNATLFINGKVADSINFGAAKYAVQQPLLSNAIAFGAAQFVNGQTLPQFLKQQNAYFASNATLMYPLLYAKALSDNDVRFLSMQDSTVSDLTFHLPCGLRSNIDTIKRMFAFGAPGMKSNNVKIVLKNSGIISESLKASLQQYILSEITQTLPATVNILGVEFADYE